MAAWREFTPVPRPKGMRKRADKACYRNAALVATRYHPVYVYAEGLAWRVDLPGVHHAWVVDADGNAIEVTWREPGARYYGTTFTAREHVDAVGGLDNLGGPVFTDELIDAAREELEAEAWERARPDASDTFNPSKEEQLMTDPEHREADVAREAKRRGQTLERLSNGKYMLTNASTPPTPARALWADPDSGMSLDEVEQVLVGATGWVLLAIQRAPFGRRVNEEQARTLAVAAEPLWFALEELGMVDDYGSMECARVLPAALEFIHNEVNRQRAEDSS